MREERYKWWQKEVIYQIYPRSYKDSNGDGIGDLKGITEKLDYLKKLGVKGVWVSPVYPSPMADFGYDVSDYTGIHPMFGTMEDFDHLLEAVHKKGLKLILDLVPNHSSDQHPWFLESRKSKDNPKRDWYIWEDPGSNGGAPNNWLSVFGGSGWEFDDTSGQYYYHAFLKEQPDLNWRNPEVQKAMLDVMRFWLDKGVDGFRVDVMWHMIKDKDLRNNPPNPDYHPKLSPYDQHVPAYSTDQPEVHDIVTMMRDLINEYDERLLIGEIYLPIHQLVSYYGTDDSGAHLPFNFQLLQLPWKADKVEAAINEYEGALPPNGWPNWVLGNHDKSRIATRVGPEQARVAAMMLLTLRGTPTIYYGDEIGMEDVPIPPEKIQDPQERNMPELGLGRDPERTPMQWDDSENAGFTTGEPWLPLMTKFKEVNVKKQWDAQDSMLGLYRKLIKTRQEESALHVGKHIPVFTKNNLLSYMREDRGKKFLIVLNLSGDRQKFTPDFSWQGKVRVSTHSEMEDKELNNNLELEGNQGLLIELS